MLTLYNTMTRTKEPFEPLVEGKVTFYSCGPTVYDYFHIGNARPLIMFDVLRRYMEFRGWEVTYIVNITDVDDKIIRRANEEGVPFTEIARKYEDAFFEGTARLGVRPATHHPRATEHIEGMQALIARLIERGHAYVSDGDVYFDVASFPSYGALSGRNVEDLRAGARIEVGERKNNPLDFALWKAAKPGEPSWDSPWGPGRPGWHIECSVMAMQYGGPTLDIHAGGQDLIFPHHENERAQSEAATGQPFIRYWLHNGFLDIEGEKMSKSLGNFRTVKDILDRYDPMAVRLFFLLKHYRSPIDFSEERIREAQAALDRLRNTYRKLVRALGTAPVSADVAAPDGGMWTAAEFSTAEVSTAAAGIIEAMDDDVNTARAMGHLYDLARAVNTADENAPGAITLFREAHRVFDDIGTRVFGIDFEQTAETGGEIVGGLVVFLVELRVDARKNRDWALADRIRDRLADLGVILEDRRDGTTWTVKPL